jgi:hypothetical protein
LVEKLSDASARKALPPTRGQLFLWDAEIKGFALRVTCGGAKSFVLDYRVDGRQRRITLGNYPDWTIQAARADRGGKQLQNLSHNLKVIDSNPIPATKLF